MAKIYKRFLSTIIPQEKDRDSFDPRSQNLSGEDSTWMVARLGVLRIRDGFFFYNLIELLWLFQRMSCVLSSARKNQLVVTIGTF